MVVVIPRIGSASSCSGEGSARGEISTFAAAQRIVATVVCNSVFVAVVVEGGLSLEVEVPLEKELRRRYNDGENAKGIMGRGARNLGVEVGLGKVGSFGF